METVIERFYNAFSNLDSETMVSCYHDDVIFEDPAFGILHGSRAKNMWRMLCKSQRDRDFKITYSNIEATETNGRALWEAFYTFSKTNRKVHNVVQAEFEFKEGKIIKHTDDFDLYKWSKQAFGFKGMALGKTMFFRNKLKGQTNHLLDKFEDSLK